MTEIDNTAPQEIDPTQLPDITEPAEQLTLRDRLDQAVEGYANWAERHPFAATTAETVALYAVKRTLYSAGEKRGINLANGHSARQLEKAAKHPLVSIAMAVAYAPITEERMFRRDIPKGLRRTFGAEEGTRAARLIDQIAVLGFAAAHIGNPLTKKGRQNLAVPISPLIGGLNYQRLTRTRGLNKAIAAHAINNALAVTEAAPQVMAARRALKNK